MAGTSHRLSVGNRQFIFRPLTKLNNCWLIKIGKGDRAHSGHFCLRLGWLHPGTRLGESIMFTHDYPWVHRYIYSYVYTHTYTWYYICVYYMLTHWLMYISTIVGSCHKPEQTTRHMFEIRTLVADISEKLLFLLLLFLLLWNAFGRVLCWLSVLSST